MGRSGTDRRFARLAAELLSQRLRPGAAEVVFPRTVDRRPMAAALAGGMQDLPPLLPGRARGHPDGSVSFGGAYSVVIRVGTVRSSAMEPWTAATQEMACEINRLFHRNALAALCVPGSRMGVLSLEGCDAAGVVGDYADRHYAKHGVHLDTVVCDRATARRIAPGAARSDGNAPASSRRGRHMLPERDDIKMAIEPGMNGLLQLIDRRATLQCTDGGIMVGVQRTSTGHGLAVAGYKEFGTANGSAKGSMSGATWSIAPADSSTVPPDQEDEPICERPWLVKTLRRPEHMALNNGVNVALSRLALESQHYVQQLAGS